ncbi:MAG: CDP-diacylglycerol--glycerol-3-phosphate 3-phosphatidyltransferase [Lentisphaerae bacterium]|jgi:CDP-diacylglycerol--glycerol-3-phosphate 3-phosphatidyltransferase|nr:CDP-diacylglycerol--glycerol-3-phosphate 3-phosphatidyltransferase [Lentisphaerota bacterium]
MNLPNTLTTSRLIAALIMMLVMALPLPHSTLIAFMIFVAASITDYWDGRLARGSHGVTAFGRLMDPLADKVLVSAALVGFVGIRLQYEPHYSLVPAWVVVVIIAREFAVTGLRLLVATRGDGRIVSASNWGKLKTVWQMVAIIATFVLLAIRESLLPVLELSEKFLRQYDGAFVITSWILSSGVVAVTLISGWKYFAAHWDLVTEEM